MKVVVEGGDHLRNHGDFYRDNADLRLSPGSQHFWYEYALLDADGGGRGYLFRFVVSDAAAKYGLLRVVYVDQGPPYQA